MEDLLEKRIIVHELSRKILLDIMKLNVNDDLVIAFPDQEIKLRRVE